MVGISLRICRSSLSSGCRVRNFSRAPVSVAHISAGNCSQNLDISFSRLKDPFSSCTLSRPWLLYALLSTSSTASISASSASLYMCSMPKWPSYRIELSRHHLSKIIVPKEAQNPLSACMSRWWVGLETRCSIGSIVQQPQGPQTR